MGKRVAIAEQQYITPLQTRTIRKRKRITTITPIAKKTLRLHVANNDGWHENDDEDSSSNDTTALPPRNQSSKQANNSSILLSSPLHNVGDKSLSNESPKPVYTLRPSVVNGTILYDLNQKPWRLGRPIGKGNFGEIFLASNIVNCPVTNDNAKYVVKVEPHSNGPLFVEIHCLMNTAKKNSDNFKDNKSSIPEQPPTGIPDYIASGSHYFNDARYRFLVLQRFDRDIHSLIKNCRIDDKSLLILAIQVLNVLQNLHDKGYCHNDVKAQNLMISKCKYLKRRAADKSSIKTNIKSKYDYHYEDKQPTTDSGNSTEQEADENIDYNVKRRIHSNNDKEYLVEEEEYDDGITSNSMNSNSNSMDAYHTPINRCHKRRGRNNIEYSGSNPVRSCRRQNHNAMYDEMVKSHYLRPTKRISYSEFFYEDGVSVMEHKGHSNIATSDDESEEFLPQSIRRLSKKSSPVAAPTKRLTRRQEKLQAIKSKITQQQYNSAITDLPASVFHEVVTVEEEHVFLIDYGLASKFMDNDVHRPFVMDQRRAHDGTLEFTSRDAHMGAHSRRSDLECLGYNLIYWSQGYLPWKEAALHNQQEAVHRAKEYLMTDVREMLKLIYGTQVPEYLGEFLHHINELAYHERPDYTCYRRIFEREYERLGYSIADMQLNSNDIVKTAMPIKEEIVNKNDMLDLHKYNGNVLNIMRRFSVGTPFVERTPGNRVSPKNLRSKSDKKTIKKKSFSWAEVLSQDPDQIARERAEKEFDREDELIERQQTTVRKYEGNPTYAILDLQQRIKTRGRNIESELEEDDEEEDEEDDEEDEEDEDEEAEQDEVDDEDEQCEKPEENDYELENSNEDYSTDAETDKEDEDTEEEEEEEHNETMKEIVNTNESLEDSETDSTENSVPRNKLKKRTRKNKSIIPNGKLFSKSIEQSTKISKRCTTLATKMRKNNIHKDLSFPDTITTYVSKNRGSATRNLRKPGTATNIQAASAAGENELNLLKSLDNIRDQRCETKIGNGVSERRTRRCCINKTEAAVDHDTTTKFNIYKVWKNYNSENIYTKGKHYSSTKIKKTK